MKIQASQLLLKKQIIMKSKVIPSLVHVSCRHVDVSHSTSATVYQNAAAGTSGLALWACTETGL